MILRRLIVLGWLMAATAVVAAPDDAETFYLPDAATLQHMRTAIASAESFSDRYEAEVWLLSKSSALERFIPDLPQRLEILRLIHREAIHAELSPEVVLAVIEVESHFNPYAVSRAGAQGLMQVMPFWKELIGRSDDNLTHIHTNLRYGCTILKHYLDMEQGELAPALARYNGSYGKNWYPDRVRVAWERHWR